MSVVLAARGLSAGYNGVPAIHEIDLEVARGEVVALLGPNGAGKTTTVLAVAGALSPLRGSVEINGDETSAALHKRARRGLSLVTEERSVFMELTCRENLRLGRGSVGAAAELFPELSGLMNRKAGLLSGGEQQILTVARALASEPSVLLADELSLGLAPMVVRRLFSAIRSAADARGTGALLIEQHTNLALDFADRAYVLNRGRVVLEGKSSELRERRGAVTDAYFEGGGET